MRQVSPSPLHGKRLCIDPGHPSEVGIGTRGKRITEVGAAWLVALRMKELLVVEGAIVVLTKRKEREKVTNKRRAEIANAAEVHLMVRLHCDSEGGSGTATFYPDRQGTAADGKRGPSREVIEASTPMAKRFHVAMMETLKGKLKDRGVMPDTRTFIGGKQGALTGSIYSKVPVVLVEMCVLTNSHDEAFIATSEGRDTMARALVAGTRAALVD